MTFTTSSSLKTLFIIVIVFAAFALTTGKDAVKIEDLAKQLETARQESAKLRQQLEKSHEETKEIIQRENNKLRSEDSKLKREAEELRKENKKLRRQEEELRQRDEELRKQDEELRQRDAKLERKVNKLHQAFRQRDQNNTLELQNVVRNSLRQMDVASELKRMMNKQIKEYLDVNKMCVMGEIEQYMDRSGMDNKDAKIEFGQTFPRIPAFAAALSNVGLEPSDSDKRARAQVYDFRVTKSSAEVKIQGWQCYRAHFIWMACM